MTPAMQQYAVEQASLRAKLLSSTAGFPSHEIDDARQELFLDCLRRSRKFNSARGDWGGFVRGVTRNHTTVLVKRRHRAAKREFLFEDLFVNRNTEVGSDPIDVLDGLQFQDIEPALQMSIDVARVLDGLPPPLQRLAGLLSELTVLEVSAKTGKSRSRVYQMIRQLRAAFVANGFGPTGAAPVAVNPRWR